MADWCCWYDIDHVNQVFVYSDIDTKVFGCWDFFNFSITHSIIAWYSVLIESDLHIFEFVRVEKHVMFHVVAQWESVLKSWIMYNRSRAALLTNIIRTWFNRYCAVRGATVDCLRLNIRRVCKFFVTFKYRINYTQTIYAHASFTLQEIELASFTPIVTLPEMVVNFDCFVRVFIYIFHTITAV